MATDGPIFVLGITGRCGSTFLLELISLHPDAREQDRIEDFFLDESDPLLRFRDRMTYRWRWMTDGPLLAEKLAPALGKALLSIFDDGSQGRLVTKTPSVRNLDGFFELFPDASLVILVRDPRSIVASAIGSWSADGDAWARQWARRSKTILDFDARHRGRGLPYRIVRYEDLLTNQHETTADILRTVGLCVDRYDFDALDEMPVRGSSERAVDGIISWEPVERPTDFAPMKRWEEWPAERLARIEWIAGDGMEAFGYERTAPQQSGLAIRNRAMSAVLWIRLVRQQAWRRVRRVRPPRSTPKVPDGQE